jgi:hypothetical protein
VRLVPTRARLLRRLPRHGLEHRRLPRLEILDVSDAGIGFPGLLEGLVQVAEITACRHSFDGAIDRSHRLKGAIDGDLVRRQTDAAPIGELLELGGDRLRVDDDGLLPLVQPIGQNEMTSTLAAIDDAAGLVLDRCDVLGADVTLRVDPHGGDAGGAKVVFRKEFVARWLAHARGNEKPICERSVKPLRSGDVETPPRSAHGNYDGGARAGRRLEANAERARATGRQAAGSCVTPSQPVPELTRSAGIQLNEQVSMRRKAKAIAWLAPDIAAPSGPTIAKPSRDYTPLGGFAFLMR